MRFFIHAGKTVSYAVMQINQAIATHLRGGAKRGVIRVRGMNAYPSGCGWYRIYGELASKGNDLLACVSFLSVRIKNMTLSKVAVQPENKLFAFEQGLLNPEILRAPRVLKVVYEKVRGHSTPRVINRAVQAGEGMLSFISETLSALHNKAVSENKLRALQAKFSH